MESTESSNLPLGVGVNNTLVTPSKSGLVLVILINNNSHNVWIHQPLYTGDLWEVSPREWKYEPVLTHKEGTNDIEVTFVQVPPEDLQRNILTNGAGCREEMEEGVPGSPDTEMENKPSFRTPPDFD